YHPDHRDLHSFPTRRSSDLDGVKRKMIRAAGVAHAQRVHAEIVERFHPGLKDGLNSGIFLHEDTPDLARAIVYVEIDGDRLLLRSEEHTSELQSLAYLVCRL